MLIHGATIAALSSHSFIAGTIIASISPAANHSHFFRGALYSVHILIGHQPCCSADNRGFWLESKTYEIVYDIFGECKYYQMIVVDTLTVRSMTPDGRMASSGKRVDSAIFTCLLKMAIFANLPERGGRIYTY